MSSKQTVLVVGPDSSWRSSKCDELVAEGFSGRVTNSTDEAWEIFQAETIAAVFVDVSCLTPPGGGARAHRSRFPSAS